MASAVPRLPLRAAIEQMIEREEGSYHVLGAYYANIEDAAIQRRYAATKLLRGLVAGISDVHRDLCREVARLTAAGETMCVWCGEPFSETDAVVPIAGRLLHREPCSAEYGTFTAGPRYEVTDAGRAALAEGIVS